MIHGENMKAAAPPVRPVGGQMQQGDRVAASGTGQGERLAVRGVPIKPGVDAFREPGRHA